MTTRLTESRLRQIIREEIRVMTEAFQFKEGEDGVFEIGNTFWGINRSQWPPYKIQLLKLQMRSGGIWELWDSADGENDFIYGPLQKFYEEYFGEEEGYQKLQQDDHAIRACLRKLR